MMQMANRGVTLIEILAASVIAAVLAGGTLSSFVTAAKLSHGSSRTHEAAYLANQTLERFRNKIACRQPGEAQADTWYDASCNPDPPVGWQSDNLSGGTLGPGASRQYRVTSADCDGMGGAGDCLRVEVKVTWNPPQ